MVLLLVAVSRASTGLLSLTHQLNEGVHELQDVQDKLLRAAICSSGGSA